MVSSYFIFPSDVFNFVAFCSLSEMMLNLLEISLASGVPASLRIYPTSTTSPFIFGPTAFIAF